MSDIIFNKNDYRILEILIERECMTPVASLSIRQLMSISNMSMSKIRSVKDNFLMMGYILEGSKDGNNKTFYITNEGIEHYKNVHGFEEKVIDEMIKNFNEKESKGDK